MKEVDVRTLACPGPVIRLKELLATGANLLRFHVADELARSNVTRFAGSRHAQVESKSDGAGGFFVTIDAGAAPCEVPAEEPGEECEVLSRNVGPLVVQISSERMGTGDEELGRLLMRAFLKTQLQLERKPDQILFYNAGVHLCCEGSVLLDDLQTLESNGVEILACGTCLNFFGKPGALRVGRVADMLEIAASLAEAGAVVRP